MSDAYIIKYNKERYPDIIKDPPEMIIVMGCSNHAIEIAKQLTDFYPGCDYLFYVEGLQ